jgi:hypothetical protein
MGLFDKKGKKEDFDGPVEEISLSKPAPGAAPGIARPQTPAPVGHGAATPAAAAPAPPPEPEAPDYGINRAIELMRLLPSDNIELVVKVVKTTLDSVNVKIATIIKDGTRKQQDIEGRITVLKKEIVDLEAEIATRKKEISALEADHKETTTVKERLILAEKMSADKPAAAAAK